MTGQSNTRAVGQQGFPLLAGHGLKRIAVFKNRTQEDVARFFCLDIRLGNNQHLDRLAWLELQILQLQRAVLSYGCFRPVRFHALSIGRSHLLLF